MRQRTPLKRAIFDRELLQKDLAKDLDIDPGTLSRIVGGAPCSRDLAERIAGHPKIGLPVEDLFPTSALLDGPQTDPAAEAA